MGLFSKKPSFCSVCNKELTHKHKPKKEWNIKGSLCGDCHFEKSKEYYEGKVRQPCIVCGVTQKITNFVGTSMAMGHGGFVMQKLFLIKKKKITARKRIFVHCVVVKWID